MTAKTHVLGSMSLALGGYILMDKGGLLIPDVEPLIQLGIILPYSVWASTGSGLSPYLLGVLVEEFGADEYDPEKRFAAVTILPTDKEPLQPAINSYNCCKELYDVDGLCQV